MRLIARVTSNDKDTPSAINLVSACYECYQGRIKEERACNSTINTRS